MAERQESVPTCTVCLELFTEPKVLPCCHTFCKKCLEGALEKSEKKEELVCPQCRAEHEVPSNGVGAFLTDYTLPQCVNDTHKTSLKRAALCESCDSKGGARAYCCDCVAHLCESCIASHQTVKFLKGHKIEDVLSENDSKKPSKSKTIYCSLHPDRVLELYCKTCQCVACLLCFVASHNGHNYGNIDTDTREEVEGQIKELISQVEANVSEFEEDLNYIKEIEQDKTEESTNLKDQINKSFDALVAAIEGRRSALVEEVEPASVKDLKEIWAQKEVVETSLTASKGALSLATRSLQCTHDVELLLLGAQVNKRLEELSENNWDPTPVVEVEMTSRIFSSDYSQTDIGKLGQILLLCTVEPEPFSVSAKETPLILGEPVTLNIERSRAYKHKKLLRSQPRVRVLHGKNKVDIPYPPTITASETETGVFTGIFTPVVSGQHVIVVEAKELDWSTESIITVTGEPSIGARVERGPDWAYSNEDGGKGSPGTVLRKSTNKNYDFTIIWKAVSKRYSHKWGNDNEYEFQLLL